MALHRNEIALTGVAARDKVGPEMTAPRAHTHKRFRPAYSCEMACASSRTRARMSAPKAVDQAVLPLFSELTSANIPGFPFPAEGVGIRARPRDPVPSQSSGPVRALPGESWRPRRSPGVSSSQKDRVAGNDLRAATHAGTGAMPARSGSGSPAGGPAARAECRLARRGARGRHTGLVPAARPVRQHWSVRGAQRALRARRLGRTNGCVNPARLAKTRRRHQLGERAHVVREPSASSRRQGFWNSGGRWRGRSQNAASPPPGPSRIAAHLRPSGPRTPLRPPVPEPPERPALQQYADCTRGPEAGRVGGGPVSAMTVDRLKVLTERYRPQRNRPESQRRDT
jgi:hypothetical protein